MSLGSANTHMNNFATERASGPEVIHMCLQARALICVLTSSLMHLSNVCLFHLSQTMDW